MKVLILIAAFVSMVSAGVAPIVIIPSSQTLIRSPLHDSAIVQSERLGGNFAYAIAEGQSFHQTVSPVIASNIRAIDSLGVSYAINPINLPILTGPATIFLDQPRSEEEQREQQKQKDLLQRQQDEYQHAADQKREEDERQLLALQEEQEKLIQDQLQDHINQQQYLNEQLLQLQQQQQNLIGGANIITTLPIAVQPTPVAPVAPVVAPVETAPSPVNGIAMNNDANTENERPSTTITDDAVIVENTALSKSSDDSETSPQEDQDAKSNENTDSN